MTSDETSQGRPGGNWLALGRTSAPLRLIAAIGVVAIWACTLDELLGFPAPDQWNVVLMAQAVAVSCPLLVARWRGVIAIDAMDVSSAKAPTAGAGRFQFSIAHLLGWMTALAVALSAAQYLARHGSLPLGLLLEPVAAVFLLGRALVALCALGVVLGTSRRAAWAAALGAAAAAGGAGLLAAYPRFPGGLPRLATSALLEGLFLVGSLAVIRTAGYRVRIGRRA